MGRHPFRTSVPVVIQAPLLLLELPRNGALQRLLIRGPVVELPHVTMKACWRRYSAEGRGEGRAADPDDWPPADEGSRCGLLLGQAALLGGGNGFTKELSTTPACQTPAGTSSRRRPPRLVPELRRAPGKRCLVPGRGVVALCRPAPPAGRKAEAAPSAVEPLQGQGQHVRSPRRPPSRLSLKLEEVDVEGGVFILGNGIDAAASAMFAACCSHQNYRLVLGTWGPSRSSRRRWRQSRRRRRRITPTRKQPQMARRIERQARRRRNVNQWLITADWYALSTRARSSGHSALMAAAMDPASGLRGLAMRTAPLV